MEIAFVVALATMLVVANAIATKKVMRDAFAERSQRVAQLLTIWLVPVAGAIIVFAIHRRSEEPSRQYRKPPDPGDDFGPAGRSAGSPLAQLDD